MKINLHKTFLFCLSFFFSQILFSQVNQFQITYGTSVADWNGAAIPTADGGYALMMDDVTNPLLRDMALIKLDSIGNILWTRTYGNTTNTDDSWNQIIEAYNGGYLIAGRLDNTPFNVFNIWIRTDSNGDTLWVKRDVIGQGTLIKTSDFGYALVGSGLTKTDSVGNVQWSKIYTAVAGQPAYGQQTSDGGYIIAGVTQLYASGGPSDWDLALIKTDSAGNIQWTKVYERPTTLEKFPKVVQANDGGYVMLGTSMIPPNQSQSQNIIIIKTDTAGNLQWAKTYDGPDSEESVDFKATGAIGYIIIGHTAGFESVQNSFRSFLMRTDGLGNPVWTKMYGDVINNPMNSYDIAADVYYTNDGGFLMSGATQSFGVGAYDVWVVKTDASGVSGCNEINENPTIGIPTFTIGTGGYDSAVFYTSSPYTISVGTWQPTKTILCLNGSLTGETENSEIGNDVLIYPNPFTDIVTITSQEKGEVEIYNVLGQEIFSKQLTTNNCQLNLSSQPSGIYFVRIVTQEGIVSRKIVKE